jgi:lipopolysaccharide export system permease protein
LVMGISVFVFILMMFQALRYTEFVLIHGVGVEIVGELLMYVAISFLPALFPMSLLFAVLLTYGRLSQDSEIVAFKASGLSPWALLAPAAILSIVVGLFSAQTSFHVAPWGNRQFELLISKLSQSKAGATIREGTFSEGFYDMVIYANQVNSKAGELEKVFIYDEHSGDVPLTVIARHGQLVQSGDHRTSVLRLTDGDIHRKGETHTKIKFNSMDLKLADPIEEDKRAKTPPSMTIEEIQEQLKLKNIPAEEFTTLKVEYHKRWAVSFACLIFGLLGVGLGTTTNKRSQKAGGLVTSLAVVIFYWIIYVSMEGMARNGQAPVALAIWAPDLIFSLIAAWTLKKSWR